MVINPCIFSGHGVNAAAIAAVFVILMDAPVHAQQYPAKPIRIISTTTAGGVNDTRCRAYAAVISQASGQNVIVENRPGRGSIIGMQALAAAAPDCYLDSNQTENNGCEAQQSNARINGSG